MTEIQKIQEKIEDAKAEKRLLESDLRFIRMFRSQIALGINKEDIIYDMKRISGVVTELLTTLKSL